MSQTVDSSGMNELLEQTLTVYGDTMSAQVRDETMMSGALDTSLILHHLDGAPRSPEDGQPYVISMADARLLRDVLCAATARGLL